MADKIKTKRRSLFKRIAVTIGLVSISFQIFTLVVLLALVLVPLGIRAADDLAAHVVVSAKSWAQAPPAQRAVLGRQIKADLGLIVKAADQPLTASAKIMPYLHFLEYALQRRTRTTLTIKKTYDTAGTAWYWSDIPVGSTLVRVGFERARVGAYPELAFSIVLLSGVLVGFGTAILLSRRLNRPLESLARNIRKIGRGRNPRTIPETGPPELVSVSRSINAMNLQIQDLIADRTALLAGLSHDLRSPLARVQLATQIMPDANDPSLKAQIERDLSEMNLLIGECIAISRGLHEEQSERFELVPLAQKLAQDFQNQAIKITTIGDREQFSVLAPPVALSRVLANLLGNAVRYGAGNPIELRLTRQSRHITIAVLDRGPGIPQGNSKDIFQPFVRLDTPCDGSSGGSGLGLFIVKQLADANGWQIELRPRTSGGTAACLTLDAAAPA